MKEYAVELKCEACGAVREVADCLDAHSTLPFTCDACKHTTVFKIVKLAPLAVVAS